MTSLLPLVCAGMTCRHDRIAGAQTHVSGSRRSAKAWLYETLFVSHSNYVHPTWHEIRAFHLRSDQDGLHLDPTHAGMAPIAAFVIARLVVEACRDAASVLPHHLDEAALHEVVANTVRASQELSVAFSEFITRGGLQPDLTRHRRS